MPLSAGQPVLEALATQPVEALQQPAFWKAFAAARGLRVIGPSTHAYLDANPGSADGIVRVNEEELSPLRRLVDEAD